MKNIEQMPILSIFKMRLEENSTNNTSGISGYKLRKKMLTFMKIKYFQLLKSYIQLGNTKDFIQLLL